MDTASSPATHGTLEHFGPISGVAAWGEYVATAGYDNRVILWDRRTRRAIAVSSHDHLVNFCSFAPDGSRLVTASSDYSARIWAIPSLQLQAVLNGHTDDVDVAIFSPDGSRVATSSHDHTIRVFHSESGKPACVMRGHGGDVLAIAWNDGGRSVVSSSDDGTVRQWCASTGRELGRISLGGAQSDALAVIRDGVFISGDDNGILYLVTPDGVVARQPAHAAGIKYLKHNDAHDRTICLSYDGTCSVWRVEVPWNLARVTSIPVPSIVWPRSCALADDETAIFGTFGSTYAEVDLSTRQWNLYQIKRDRSVNALCVVGEHVFDIGDAGILRLDGVPISDNQTLCNFLIAVDDAVLTGGQSGILLDARSATPLFRHRSPLNCAAVYGHGTHTRLVVGTYTGELLFFAVERHDGRLTVHPISTQKPHANAVKGLAVAHGKVFSCCADGSVAWNRAEDFSTVHRISPGHTSIANGCTATPSGFASVGRDLKLRFWTDTFVQRCVDTPHRNSIRCIAASASGRYLATGGYRGVIAIYDLHEDAWVHTLRATSFGISCVAADQGPDGFIASSYDGLTHRFNANARS